MTRTAQRVQVALLVTTRRTFRCSCARGQAAAERLLDEVEPLVRTPLTLFAQGEFRTAFIFPRLRTPCPPPSAQQPQFVTAIPPVVAQVLSSRRSDG